MHDLQNPAAVGSSLYYSLLFTRPEQREAIVALHTLQHELQNMTEHYREVSVIKAKLQWWQQEMLNVYAKQEAQHSITKTLLPAIQSYQLPQQLFTEWLDGAFLKLESDHLCTEEDLLFFCYREYGICALLSAYVLGFKEHSSLQGVHDLAISVAILRLIQALRHHLYRGWCFIPLSLLEQHGVTEVMLQSGQMSPELRAALDDLWQLAQRKYESGLEKIPPADKKTLKPLIINANLSIKLGKEIAAEGFPVLTEQTSLTPLSKLFIAWKLRFLK